ncbi:MAG: hypothetical protein OEZ22_11150 [Spirochaetia bacterium]|nr:hypothetical protein [Spirochaetia bacterium]
MAEIMSKHKPRYHGMKVTREIYLDLEDDGYRYDMIDGVLYMSPSASFEHNKNKTNWQKDEDNLISSVLYQFKLNKLEIFS